MPVACANSRAFHTDEVAFLQAGLDDVEGEGGSDNGCFSDDSGVDGREGGQVLGLIKVPTLLLSHLPQTDKNL